MLRFLRKIGKSEIQIDDVSKRAYLAGLFDADGFFRIGVYRTKSPPRFYPQIGINMTNEDVIGYVADLLGYDFKSHKKEEKRKETHITHFTIKKDVKNFLTQLFPFLIVKRQHASLILELISLEEDKSQEKNLDTMLKELDLWYKVGKLQEKGKHVTKEDYEKLRKSIIEFFNQQ